MANRTPFPWAEAHALLFFFRHILHRDFGRIDGVIRAKRHRYIPVVLSKGILNVRI